MLYCGLPVFSIAMASMGNSKRLLKEIQYLFISLLLFVQLLLFNCPLLLVSCIPTQTHSWSIAPRWIRFVIYSTLFRYITISIIINLH